MKQKNDPSHGKAQFQIITSGKSLRYGLSAEHQAIYGGKVATVGLWSRDSDFKCQGSVTHEEDSRWISIGEENIGLYKQKKNVVMFPQVMNTEKGSTKRISWWADKEKYVTFIFKAHLNKADHSIMY